MDRSAAEILYGIFEEKMSQVCSVVPSGHSKSIVSDDWVSYIASLGPQVESIRPSEYMRARGVVPRKTGNFPVLALLAERINEGEFDRIVIEDPGVGNNHIPAWGPNLLLVDRGFADKVLLLGELP